MHWRLAANGMRTGEGELILVSICASFGPSPELGGSLSFARLTRTIGIHWPASKL